MENHIMYPQAAGLTHKWLRKISVAFVPGPTTPMLEEVAKELLHNFQEGGHKINRIPDTSTDVILTTALFGKPVKWPNSLLFTARRRFNLDSSPIVFTLMQASPRQYRETMETFEKILVKEPPDPLDFEFPGLGPKAYRTLYEQGRRGGPILALVRLLQTQAMSIRNILVIGEDVPLAAYTFDLVGAHPRTDATEKEIFYKDIVNRIVTAASTKEV